MTVSEVRPWRKALRRERSLPSGVTGPVLLRALRRLASICLNELIADQPAKLASFRHFPQSLLRPSPQRLQYREEGVEPQAKPELFGCVSSHSPLATSNGLMLSFSHQATSLPA